MLPILLDAAGFQKAANLSPPQFLNAMMQSLIPPAVGLWNGQALWTVDVVDKATKQLASLIESGVLPADVPQAVASVVVSESNTTQPNDSGTFHAQTGDWPDQMNQVMAERYLGVASSWLDKQIKAGLISTEKLGLYKMYRRADLDALAQLPVYKYRKRHGFTGGMTKEEAAARAARKFKEPRNETVFGDKAASEFLGIGYGILALTRKDGSGPAWFNDNGTPRYRLQDLEVFKERMDKEKLPHFVAQGTATVLSPAQAQLIKGSLPKAADTIENERTAPTRPRYADDAVLNKAQAAQWLGVKPKSLENWKMRGTGPAWIKDSAGVTRWTVQALKDFERDHSASLEHSRRMCGFYTANPDKVPVIIRQQKALNGPRKPAKKAAATKASAKGKPAPSAPRRGKNAAAQSGAPIRH